MPPPAADAAPTDRIATLTDQAPIDLSDDWQRAIAVIAARQASRVAVIGPTDVGKSSFIRALARETGHALIDLDPGQKMIGPPGSAALGTIAEGETAVERWRFLGTTSASAISRIVEAAAALAEAESFVANTSGFVAGPGARLQASTIAALRADLVVAIGLERPPLPRGWNGTVIPLARAPLARRKTAALRRRIRQRAFAQHLGGATLRLSSEALLFEPSLPAPPSGDGRPVCSLADEAGEDMAIGVLLDGDAEGGVVVQAAAPPRPVARLRLGRMWAVPSHGEWELLDRLHPGWAEEQSRPS